MKPVYFPTLQNLYDHFKGNKTLARAAFALFLAGIAVFVFNNTYLFFVEDEATYFYPRLVMRFIVSFLWLIAAILGTRYNRTKRNILLLPALTLYMIADVVVMFSIPASAAFYGCGHLFLIAAILETTYIRRYQYVVTLLLTLVVIAIMVWYFKGITLVGAFGIIYGFICVSAMSLSLSNRFYCIGGIVFLISDIAGFARVALMNNKITYVITTFIYYLSIFLLCISVYNESKKQAVTWGDLIRVFQGFEKKNLRVWLAGRWGMGIILKKREFMYEKLDLAYDTADEAHFSAWLKENKYEALDASVQSASGAGSGEFAAEAGAAGAAPLTAGHYYSEKFGHLTVLPCTFRPDGSAILVSEHNKALEMDADYFKDTLVLRRRIYCLAPGGKELIREAAGSRFTD